ncbi:helix-turn-helix transcriptional regulator [Paraburkholderia guartelaensis]|uniref:helix-turn-helix transcriptional regulator n=1 Tax=Paraburkholderia guartelaensis TaxID=2546446 RepID=UPI002AB702D5|nr:AraC family transcriptional regulator [Paraburkholderia guartelaensis]
MSETVCPALPGQSAAQVFNVDLASCAPGHASIRDWYEILHENYFRLDVKVGSSFRSGSLERVDIGNIRACMLKCDPMLTERRASPAGPDTRDFYVVEIPQATPVTLTQRGRESVIQPGDFAIVNGAEGYTFAMAQRNEVRTLRIPCRSLLRRLPAVDDKVALTCHGSEPTVALFLEFAQTWGRHANALPPELRERTEQHLLDLLVMALSGTHGATSETSVRSAHRQRALRTIEDQFANPALEPVDIARALGLSERYLQKIFAEREETVSSTIRRRRVLEAKRLLAARAQNRQSVTQIAFSVGFSDPSHFSRVFRQETGVSPVQYTNTDLD